MTSTRAAYEVKPNEDVSELIQKSVPLYDSEEDEWDERFEPQNLEAISGFEKYKIEYSFKKSDVAIGIQVLTDNPSMLATTFEATITVGKKNYFECITRSRFEISRSPLSGNSFMFYVIFEVDHDTTHLFNVMDDCNFTYFNANEN